MNVGATTQFTLSTGASTPAVVSSLSLILQRPDGVTESLTPTQSSYTLYASYTPPLAGSYTLTWGYILDGASHTVVQHVWVAWTPGIYDNVRRLLRASADSIDDSLLDFYMESLVDTLFAQFPGLLSYWLLEAEYRSIFDTGVSWLLAADINPSTTKTFPTTSLIAIKKGTTTFQYAQPQRVSLISSPESVWAQRGWDLLSQIPYIYSTRYKQLQDATDLVPTRGDLATGNTFSGDEMS